jgi:hypothetical protein
MSDVVEEVLIHVFSAWRATRADVVKHRQDGFDWLPGHHVVHVHCNERQDDSGEQQFRLSVTTEYLRGAPINDPAFVRQAASMADFLWPTCAPVYRQIGADGKLPDFLLCSSIYFNARRAEALTALFAGMALLQPVYAELQSTNAPGMLGGGVPARSPREGAVIDTATELANEIIYSEGAKPSAWTGSVEFEEFAAERRNEHFNVAADRSGMTIEMLGGSASTRVVFQTDEPHPHHGNGLLVRIELFVSPDLDEVCRQAARLNLLEASSWTGFPQLGCWCATEISKGRFQLGHCTFIPNSSFMPHLVGALGGWALERIWWANSILQPTEEAAKSGQSVRGWVRKLWSR